MSKANHGQVSPPLPLPFGFTLLPCRLPGRHLTPLLYTSVNGLPVYMTICPSHAPHVSLLPILLALRAPATPLGVLIEYGLSSAEYSLDIDGVAPWPDFWVPLDTARPIIQNLGAARLFWDVGAKAGSKGMLGNVADAVSWQEGDGWYHNWLPSKTHLPESSYSLDSLLSNSWSFIEIIPDDRCVFTPAGKQRTARLVAEGSATDLSKLRSGPWAPVWDHLLGWNFQAWAQYRSHPSRLTTPRHIRHRTYPVVELANALPTLFGVPSSKATMSLASSDFVRLLPATLPTSSIPSLVLRLLATTYRHIETYIPVLRHVTPASLRLNVDEEETQWLARLNLAMCALVSDVVLGIWRLRRDNDRLRAALASRGDHLPADIAISASAARDSKPPSQRTTSESSSAELDVLIQLERRRGGSPPPPSTAIRRKGKRQHKAAASRHSQSSLARARPKSELKRDPSSSSQSSITGVPTSQRKPRREMISSPGEMSSSSRRFRRHTSDAEGHGPPTRDEPDHLVSHDRADRVPRPLHRRSMDKHDDRPDTKPPSSRVSDNSATSSSNDSQIASDDAVADTGSSQHSTFNYSMSSSLVSSSDGLLTFPAALICICVITGIIAVVLTSVFPP